MSQSAELEVKPAGLLLVDDEPHVISALQRTLRDDNWLILSAPGGAEALELLRRHEIQVVISDFRMPGMDGVEFLLEVKRLFPDIQRVMLTGHADSKAVERAINDSEVFRFINKPWNNSQLRATVNECLDRYFLIQRARRYEKELAERNAELERMNRELEKLVAERTRALLQSEKIAALGRMAGGVAHEINNPLGGILAFVQVLRREPSLRDRGSIGDALRTIEECAVRCKNIVDGMLRFSRRDPAAPLQLVDLSQVASSAVALARLHPRAHSLELCLETAPGQLWVTGRQTALEQVALNLLQNAILASPEGGRVIVRTSSGGGQVLLEVIDRGPGITEEQQAHLFEPFYTTRQPGEGTGLGLFVAWGIVQDHRGAIEVEGRPGKGACFRVKLPAASGEEERCSE